MLKKLGARFVPFLVIGLLLAFFVVILIIIWYVFIWGLVIGVVLFSIAFLRAKFFKKSRSDITDQEHKREGITIDHDDL